ncbi:MAG: DAK2 domain-containing protein [Clostridium sp.]|nr:DAK2 domain-containing protein [Clostridium sp.]
MASNSVDAKMLTKMFLAGAKNLESKKEWINELNVFPVPDGDTGTNMTLTIMSAAKEVTALGDSTDMKAICKAISSGSLRGARGNSGVILSQLLRGFTKVAADFDELTIPVIVEAMDKAVETAYKAVMKPKEGTILTVAKGIAVRAGELCDEGVTDLGTFIEECITYGNDVLARTPEMLPVLKQAGVVDSGGQGLMQVMAGIYDAYCGKELDLTIQDAPARSGSAGGGPLSPNLQVQADMEIKYGYCTEFIILLSKTFNIKHEIDFKEFLESIGDSIVLVADDEIVKVHVHTNDPGLAIQRALKYGQLSNMKIDNMRMEHQEKLFKMSEKGQMQEIEQGRPAAEPVKEPPKEVGFIAVAAGDGMAEIFKGLGVDFVISGGQTMNPSTEDMLDAIAKVNAENIFILPNNKNIIMAANQAADLTENKKILVVPTKTIPQGITSVINYTEDVSPEENLEAMKQGIETVRTGEVTYAIRDTTLDGREIHKDDFMGIGDNGLLAVSKELSRTACEMIDAMMDDDMELISIYYGADVTEDDAEALRTAVEERYSSCDVELQYGGQPVYYYIVSVE